MKDIPEGTKVKIIANPYNNGIGFEVGDIVVRTEGPCDDEFSLRFDSEDDYHYLEPIEYAIIDIGTTEYGAIKSDGGSSGYYDFKVPQHYLELIDNTGIIKTEYLIDILFGNDFDFGCAFKALIRSYGITVGQGKAGNTLTYELNKLGYYKERIAEKNGWRPE